MNKKDIKRESLKSNDLKKVIFRIDYGGVSDILSAITELSKTVFIREEIGEYVNGSLETEEQDIQYLSDLLKVNKNAIRNATVHKFSKIKKFFPNNVTVLISKYSLCMVVECGECGEYTGFDSYNRLIQKIWAIIFANNPLISVKRVGLRKICAFFALDNDSLRERVEYEAFPAPIVRASNPDCTHTDSFFWEDKNIHVTLTRILTTGFTIKNDKRQRAFQFSMDYDTYYHGEKCCIYNPDKVDELFNLITHLNDAHFELFKLSVTENYLNILCNGQ